MCKALEIGNPSQAIARLDEDEKENTLISNEGITRGNPNMTVVNEAGLSDKNDGKIPDVAPTDMRSARLTSSGYCVSP